MNKQLWLKVVQHDIEYGGLFKRDKDVESHYEGFLIGTGIRGFDPVFVIRTNSGKIIDNIRKEDIVESKWREVK